MRARNNVEESMTHISLKMLCLILMHDLIPLIEPQKKFHRKYAPDLITKNGKIWGEAGQVRVLKLIEISSIVDYIYVMKKTKISAVAFARELRKRKPQCNISVFGWDQDIINEINNNIRKHNEIKDIMIENDILFFKHNDNIVKISFIKEQVDVV